jgi:hypothetical protein
VQQIAPPSAFQAPLVGAAFVPQPSPLATTTAQQQLAMTSSATTSSATTTVQQPPTAAAMSSATAAPSVQSAPLAPTTTAGATSTPATTSAQHVPRTVAKGYIHAQAGHYSMAPIPPYGTLPIVGIGAGQTAHYQSVSQGPLFGMGGGQTPAAGGLYQNLPVSNFGVN